MKLPREQPSANSVSDRDNKEIDDEDGDTQNEDYQEIKSIVQEFAAAYFGNDICAVKKYLASTYEGNVDIYGEIGAINILKIKGLSDEEKIKSEKCEVSLEFTDSSAEDMLLYLTLTFVKEDEGWKVQFYGIEG